LHSAHPTIGSGTRIAMEDSIALIDSLAQFPTDIARGLAEFRRIREPQKNKLVNASEKSFTWYEEFGSKVDSLSPIQFLFDFFMRTGRVSCERLLLQYPVFMAKYGSRWAADAATCATTASAAR
jgi:2-polyprenyl-6-methoxyphenol hydroxylase-like FAD-dependent oxidoreductase